MIDQATYRGLDLFELKAPERYKSIMEERLGSQNKKLRANVLNHEQKEKTQKCEAFISKPSSRDTLPPARPASESPPNSATKCGPSAQTPETMVDVFIQCIIASLSDLM